MTITDRVTNDARSAALHCRILKRLALAVDRRSRFWINGWRRCLRTNGYDDVVC